MLRDSIDYKGTAVGKLFRRFLFPTVMGMVFSAVFVITDGIFVGRGIGSDALAAVNLTAPLFTLGTGLGLMFGMGGSVVASVNLAQGKRRVAQINITQSLVIPALLIALLSALLIHCHKPLLLLLGTPPELMVPAREYLVWFTLFLAPLAVFNILMFIVRLDGAPRFAMACNIMAACINIVLDYLFIFEFGWGLAGAAIATGIGYIVGSGVMLRYMLRSSRTLHFVKLKTSYKSLRLTARNLGYMTYIGFPALLSELAISCLDDRGQLYVHPLHRQGRRGGVQHRLLYLPDHLHGLQRHHPVGTADHQLQLRRRVDAARQGCVQDGTRARRSPAGWRYSGSHGCSARGSWGCS